jgi:hypothetical protein
MGWRLDRITGERAKGVIENGERLLAHCQNSPTGGTRCGQNDWPLQPCPFLESSPPTVSLTPSLPLFADLGFATAFICSLDS